MDIRGLKDEDLVREIVEASASLGALNGRAQLAIDPLAPTIARQKQDYIQNLIDEALRRLAMVPKT